MSLLNDASLVMIPSGYKDTKLYSVKPTDGSGDFTFSRGSNLAATRVNSEGLIEKGRENLLLQSNTFDTTWTNSGSTETGGQSGYDGSSDAWLLSKLAGSGRLQQAITKSGVCTLSVYAKAGTLDWVWIRAIDGVDNPNVFFDLQNGVKGITAGTNYIDSSIEQVGATGWYRLKLVFSQGITEIRIYPADDDGDVSGTSGSIYIQDAQLEVGLVATDYIETTTTTAQAGILEDMPRLDYSGGATCPSLILESQRSNAMANSEYFGGYNIAQMTLEHNYAISPEGVQNATRLIENTAGGTAHSVSIATPTTATEHGWSVYAKPNGRDYIYLYVGSGVGQGKIFDIANGAIGSNVGSAPNDTKIEDAGNGWYRCTIFVNGIAGSPTPTIGLANSLTSFTYTGDGTSGVFIYGAMLEAGSYPTSYIPTYGSSVTRSKDVANDLSAADLIGNDEGVIFIDVQMPSVIESNTTFSIGGGTSTEYAQIEIRTDLTINWRYRLGGTDYINANVGSYVAGDRLKIAFAYKNNDSVLYKNGSSIATDTGSVATNSWDEVRFSNFAGTGNLNASVNQTLLFKTRLSNDELAALTTI